MIKIISISGNSCEGIDLKDGDVIDVSSGELRIVDPERVQTLSCGCTYVDGKLVFACFEHLKQSSITE